MTAGTIRARDQYAVLVFLQIRGKRFGAKAHRQHTNVGFNIFFAAEGLARCDGISSVEKTGDISGSNLS